MSPSNRETQFYSGAPATTRSVVAERALVPEGLLDGDELVLLAVKPSLWFILLRSGPWIVASGLVVAVLLWYCYHATATEEAKLGIQTAVAVALVRVSLAMFQWASRLYVLTNRRVMRIKGILHVDVFECPLSKIQNTFQTFSLSERIVRVGTIHIATAGTDRVEARWQHVAQPLEVHALLRDAITRSRCRGTDL